MVKILVFILVVALVFGFFFLAAFFCWEVQAYREYRKRTLNHCYQKMNYNTFVSTYQLFPERYDYCRHEGNLCYLTYEIISQGIHLFFPNKTEYYILFDFKDWFRVDNYLFEDEDEKKKRQISERETNAVLEDLQRLCRQEIEKADREVSDALENMYRVTENT